MNFTLEEIVDDHLKSLGKLPHASGMVTDRAAVLGKLSDIITQLKAKGITLSKILTVLGPILTMVTAGTPAGAIITSILSLLGGVAPTLPGASGT